MLGKQSVNEKILQREWFVCQVCLFCIHKMNALYVKKMNLKAK